MTPLPKLFERLLLASAALAIAGCDCKTDLVDKIGAQNTDLIIRQLWRQSEIQAPWGECGQQNLPLNQAACAQFTEEKALFASGLVCKDVDVDKKTELPAPQTLLNETQFIVNVPGVVKGSLSGSVVRSWSNYCAFDIDHQHQGSGPIQGASASQDPQFPLRNIVTGGVTFALKSSASGGVTLMEDGVPDTVNVTANAECTFSKASFQGCTHFEDGKACGERHTAGGLVWRDPDSGKYVRRDGQSWQEWDEQNKRWVKPGSSGSVTPGNPAP